MRGSIGLDVAFLYDLEDGSLICQWGALVVCQKLKSDRVMIPRSGPRSVRVRATKGKETCSVVSVWESTVLFALSEPEILSRNET